MLKQSSDNERYTKVLLRTGYAYWSVWFQYVGTLEVLLSVYFWHLRIISNLCSHIFVSKVTLYSEPLKLGTTFPWPTFLNKNAEIEHFS